METIVPLIEILLVAAAVVFFALYALKIEVRRVNTVGVGLALWATAVLISLAGPSLQ